MSKRGPQAPYVSTVEELEEIVSAVKAAGAFSFDVETRGNIRRHPDVMALIDAEWHEKLQSLKSTHPTVLAKSRQAIEDRWTSSLALDTLRNEVFWIGIATEGQSWAIPMGHPNGEVLVRELRGDGTTVPPPGYRDVLSSGKESMKKAKFFVPAVFTEAPSQLTQSDVFPVLEAIFMDPDIVKVNQNIKFDAKSVAKYYGGRLPKGLYVDTQILMHIADENLINYRLSTILDKVFKFDPYHRDGKIGKTITTEAFSVATRYVHYDCRWAWLTYRRLWRLISRVPSLYHALNIDLPTVRPVAQMEMNGILVNKREMVKLGKELDMQLNNLIRDISVHAPLGFNPDSNADKVKLLFGKKSEGGLGLKPTKKTDGGNPSVDAESLEKQRGKHPVVDLILEYSEVKKMKSTYVEGMEPLLHNVGSGKWYGRVHPQFHFHRTATGRFSCVSGDTLLTTSRGTFRFEDYIPQVNDLVPTHTGIWQPVIRKVFKGYEPMLSVRLSNGSLLQCTEQHRILTPNGWEAVGDLTLGSEVHSYVGFKEVYGGSGQRSVRAGSVPGGSAEADARSNRSDCGYHLPQRAVHREQACGWGTATTGEGTALLTLQDGAEPYAGQEWRAAPQLPGLDWGWTWLSPTEGGEQVRSGTPARVRPGSGDGDAAPVVGGAPHQRGQDGQLSGQPRPGNTLGAWEAAHEVASITEIAPLGTMGVWDIEVADDHSYATHGFLNHNSSDPNLQNIPRDGRMRSLFVAEPGHSLVVADYSQIEMRIMAMFSQDPALLHIFENDIDVHTGTATVILGREPVDGEERNIYGKVPNFLMGYGGGAKRLVIATNGKVTQDQAQFIVGGYNNGYAGLTTWKSRVLAKARKQGYVETMGGRRRRLPDLNADTGSKDGWYDRARAERQAINAIVQGTAAEICKEAMVKLDNVLEWPTAKLLVQVHDEVVTSCPTDELGLWVPRIETAMGNGTILTDGIVEHGVKLVVEAHYAGSWYDAKG